MQGSRTFFSLFERRIGEFLFVPGSPVPLAILRIIFFGFFLLFFTWYDALNRWNDATMQPATYAPRGLIYLLGVGLQSEHPTNVIFGIYVAGMAMALVGFFTRAGALMAGICGVYLYAMPSSFGKIGHGNMIVLFTTFTFAMSRAGDALSVDAMIRRMRGIAVPGRSGEYTWPIRVVWIFMALIFFATGVAKLRWGGYDWLFTPHLASTIRQHYLLPESRAPGSPIGLWIASHEWLCIMSAWLTVFVELFFPLALVNKWCRLFFVPMMFLLQFGIGFSMGVFFFTFFVCYLFWLPWEVWGLRSERAMAERAIVERAITERVSERASEREMAERVTPTQ